MADYYQDDLIEELVARHNLSRAFAQQLARAVLDCWRRAILRDDRVHLPKIGVLKAAHVPRYQTVSPQAGPVTVPAYRRMTFRTSETLRDELRLPDGKRQDAPGPNQ